VTKALLVGVRFCGGCNPQFNRGDFWRAVQDCLVGEAVQFVPAEQAELILIISGCVVDCTSRPEGENPRYGYLVVAGDTLNRASISYDLLAVRTAEEIKAASREKAQ
jgi:hypothetical protein